MLYVKYWDINLNFYWKSMECIDIISLFFELWYYGYNSNNLVICYDN